MKRHLIYIIMPMAMGFAACDPEGFLDTPVPSNGVATTIRRNKPRQPSYRRR